MAEQIHRALSLLPLALGALMALLLAPGPALLLAQDSGATKREPALSGNPLYQSALQALRDSVPAVAAEKLRQLLTESALPPEDLAVVKARLLEALVRQGQTAAAPAAALCEDPGLPSDSVTAFWRAQALGLASRFSDAETAFREALADPAFPHRAEASLSLANQFALLGDFDRALQTLRPVLDGPDATAAARARLRAAELHFLNRDLPSARRELAQLRQPPAGSQQRVAFLRGKMALAESDWDEAERVLLPVVNDTAGTATRVHHAAYLALADSYASRGETDKAERVVKAFLEKHPGSALVETAFDRLDQWGVFARTPVDPDLLVWVDSPSDVLKAIATYYLGLAQARIGQGPQAIQTLGAFRENYPDHPHYLRSLLQAARLYVEAGNTVKALEMVQLLRAASTVPEVLTHASFLEAQANFVGGKFSGAARQFDDLRASEEDPEIAHLASFNAALAALQLQDDKTFGDQLEFLGGETRETMLADLLLQRALYKASRGGVQAAEELLEFVKRYPKHENVAQAHIALSEIYLLEFPPKPVSARQHLEIARTLPLSAGQAEHIDYVAVWIEESARADDAAIALGNAFIEKWPASARVPELHMKLGEIYYRKKDYPNAVIQFELLAEKAAQSSMAERALYFAGQAARLTMNPGSVDQAIEIWGRVIDRKGELALHAREQQALAKMDLGQEAEAITVFDSILANDPPPSGDLLFSVLSSKGQAYYVLAAKQEGALDQAIAVFDQVIIHEKVTAFWRNQASVRKGKCLEHQGDLQKALQTYYDVVLTDPAAAGSKEPPEFLWFFRAGFEAIRLLETVEDWRGAIGIAERLAASGGTRAEEAAAIANRLRLDHFIWEE